MALFPWECGPWWRQRTRSPQGCIPAELGIGWGCWRPGVWRRAGRHANRGRPEATEHRRPDESRRDFGRQEPQRLMQAADAIQEITADDISRSGASSIPEVLRLEDNL